MSEDLNVWLNSQEGAKLTEGFTFSDGRGRVTHYGADVRVGDRLVPSEIFVNVRGGPTQPDYALKIEVRDGLPQWVEVTLRARPGGAEVRDKDLSVIPLEDWLEQIVAQCSLKFGGTFAGGVTSRSKPTDDRTAIADIRRTRAGRPRTLTPERLQQVADIYRQHFKSRPTGAVARAFDVADRTASKYVQRAREAGYLPPTERGKKKM